MIARSSRLTLTALALLSGCAAQSTDPIATSTQRLDSLESQWRNDSGSTLSRIDQLARKVDQLAADLKQLRETTGAQAHGDRAEQQALAARVAQAERHLRELEAAAKTSAAALPALREKTGNTEEGLRRLEAGLVGRLDELKQTHASERAEEKAEFDGRLHAAATHLQQLDTQLAALQTRAAAGEAALPRLDEKIARADERLGQMATHTREALAQSATLQAALPGLNERDAATDALLRAHEARLAALSQRLEEVAAMAQDALDATGLGQRKIYGKVVEVVTLTEDKTLFPITSPEMGAGDRAKLDALARRLKAFGTHYHLQIQGHTDGFGADDYNYELGKARAEVVKNYLNEHGGIPLFRMSVMSYGSLEAAGQPDKSNRRIVLQVLQ